MIFRKATQADRAAIYALYRSLVGTPRCTWDENYPGWLQINEDLAAGGLYVMAQGDSILGAISIVAENELDALPCWKCRMAKEIARVAVTPGKGDRICNGAERLRDTGAAGRPGGASAGIAGKRPRAANLPKMRL